MDIKLTSEEFEHIMNHPPGTCDCKICRKFWFQVGEWLKIYKEDR